MEKTYQVRGVPHQIVEHMWKFAEPYVKRALDHTHGEISHLDILSRCLNRDIQLWMIYDGQRIVGAGTTEIVMYPQMKVCRIITLAGAEFDGWMHFAHDIIEAWARDQGCDAMEAYTRKGFVPKLHGIGYRHKYSVCHKSLKE